MRKLFIMVCLMLCAMASASAQTNAGKFTIIGTWQAGNDGDTVYLVQQVQRQMMPVATCAVKDHKFSLEGVAAENITVVSVYGSQNQMLTAAAQPVFAVSGAKISIDLPNNERQAAHIYGEPNNEVWQKLMAEEQRFSLSHKDLYDTMNDSTLNMLERFRAKQKIDSLNLTFRKVYVKSIMDNMPLPICGLMLSEFQNTFDESDVQQIMSAMAKKMPNDPYYKAVKARMEALEETAIGRQYKDIALFDTKGNMLRLSEVVRNNKLTIVDFWASWCRPCLAELPNVKRVYEKYHEKGLEIYGVSLDENQLQWQAAIERLRMNWIQVSDLKGWQSAGAKTYSIQSIPATILIDQSGKIVAKDLRGEKLGEFVGNILK